MLIHDNHSTHADFNKLHELELMIACEIKRICEMHNIPFFITAGTLLGAVRHCGFIPWDDDFDIGMRRENYEHFLEVCKTELESKFFLQTWDTDESYPFSYAKIRLKDTHFVESFSEGTEMCDGIFVDIFPFDNAPNAPLEKKIQACRYWMCKRILWMKKGFGRNIRQESSKQRIKYYASLIFSSLFTYSSVKAYYDKIQRKYNNEKTQCVVAGGADNYSIETICADWVDNLEPIRFEGEYFPAFVERISYLEHVYGDYMQLPPIEKRFGHQPIKIDFGKY